MEVCEEIISYPFIKYNTSVSHVTPRLSTTFEWLFLEALIKSEGTVFQSENLQNFFHRYFRIDNPEKLIKPILKQLYDLRAVTCEKLTDEIPLSEIALSDVRVLPIGKEMQHKGLLPGAHSDDRLDVVYDVSQKKLVSDRNKLTSEPKGNYISIEKTIFPERLVREYIENMRFLKIPDGKTKKGQKNKQQRLDWLKDNTEIVSITPTKTETVFDNISHKVQLKDGQDGLVWKIEDNKIIELEETSLNQFSNVPPQNLTGCPVSDITKPDEEINQIILFKDLNKHIQIHLHNEQYKTSIVEKSFFQEGDYASKNKKKSGRGIIVFNTGLFSTTIDAGVLIVRIPEKLSTSKYIYINEKFSINAEKFSVKAGMTSKEITFAYTPKKKNPNITKFILYIVEKYYMRDESVLFLLNEENGLKNEFQTYFEKLISNCTVKEKANRINELNQQSMKLTGKKCVSDETVFNLIINKEEIKQNVTDFSSARKVLEEYSSIPIVKNQVSRDFLKTVLESLDPTDSVEEIWQLIDFIKQKTPDSLGSLDKQGILGKLYSTKAKNNCFEKAFSNGLNSAHCDFEERVLNLATWYQKIKSISDEKKLKDALNAWKNNFGNLRKHYGTIEFAEKYNREIESKFSEIRSINGGKR
ncbi:MAG: hypothetical protein K6G18_00835 [Treponema sp.]|nr:hypothetical protein [Treponema sp.]